jgi:hypothetical protein
MGQTVQLTIPKACHEDWHTMTADQKGRYCKSCCKTVVDFTNMSDRAILHHIANAGGSRICGRLYPDQLHRSMTIQKESRWPWLKYFFQFTLPAFLISMKAQGQEMVRQSTVLVQVNAQSNGKQALPSDSAGWTIRGRIVDHEGVALPGASIVIEGSNRGTSTDENGYFSFNWPKHRNVVLVVSSVGFKPLRKKIKAKHRQGSMLLHLKMAAALSGEVEITYL